MAKDIPKEEIKKDEPARYELVEVPTQTAVMIKDNKIDNVMDDKQVIAEILNSLEAIKKAVC